MPDPRQQPIRPHAAPHARPVPAPEPVRDVPGSRVALPLRRDILVTELQREYARADRHASGRDGRRSALLRELAAVERELASAGSSDARALPPSANDAASDALLIDVTGPTGSATAAEPASAPPRRRHPLRRAAVAAFDAVLVAAVALTLFVGYGMVDNRWYHVVAIEGGSMEPTIHKGDLAVVVRPPDKVRVGMVVTMEVEGKVLTHRVVEVHRDGTFVTKGDANTVRDDFRGLSVRVVGEVLFTIPALGDFLSMGHGPGPAPAPSATAAP